jgi:hypothetical protein
MNFLGSSFNKEKLKSPQQFREQLQRDLDDLNADIQRLNVEAQQLQKKATASGVFQKAQLQEAQKNLEIAKHDLIVVNAIEDIQQQWQIKTVAIETIVNEQRLLEKQRQETQGLLEQNRTDYVAAKESQDIFFKQTQDSTLLLQRLQNLKPEELDSIEFQAVLGVSVSDLVELEAEQAKLKVLKESLNSKINSFVQ